MTTGKIQRTVAMMNHNGNVGTIRSSLTVARSHASRWWLVDGGPSAIAAAGDLYV